MLSDAPDKFPTLNPTKPTIFATQYGSVDIVGNAVGILSGADHTPSGQMATDTTGYDAHIVKCRVHTCEVC